ncbi:MAG: chemotaxis protein [Candidatus Omnitrophica bacterium]|nr:chemotaxis protein [Candidatus Omnitrophota bacterium]
MTQINDENKKGILLESGTNELEVVEFCVDDSYYAINIAKVCEIIKADIEIVSVPDTHQSIDGAINIRGKIIPVINLGRYLKNAPIEDKKESRIIVSEFNKMTVGFWVTSVARIHRLSWKQVEPPSEMLQTDQGYAVGVIRINDKVLFLLDFEKIAAHINPRSSMDAEDRLKNISDTDKHIRSSKVILIAEDSDFIRTMLDKVLRDAGYKTMTAMNGSEVWEYLTVALNDSGFTKIEDIYSLLITDIEMPQVDGLHLIKRIKGNPKLRELPCIAFSSMISEKLRLKCKSVGSDGEIAKPEIEKLVELVDKLSL